MKLLYGNGRVLEARDVGPVLVRFRARAGGPPIKHNGYEILEDAEARDRLEAVRETGLYERDKA
ncbi:MAG TPA: hypothetical protein VNN79_23620 [Actinomycetota bacterium]|nr:hypothetical protein [Actinomycetota bacterium]